MKTQAAVRRNKFLLQRTQGIISLIAPAFTQFKLGDFRVEMREKGRERRYQKKFKKRESKYMLTLRTRQARKKEMKKAHKEENNIIACKTSSMKVCGQQWG